ncbi:type II toxin-antitoxin system RelE/ParE family toxin [Candidatus Bipolaricaulota bacterium]|nr:type II toxin-antitoxin system RelE/ParE family toxin [Candidatus Bipolaricaulota bacterium]
MTTYRVELLPQASDELVSLDKPVVQRVLKKLKWLAENFEDLTPETLSGELKGLFKLRVGSYRVIYSFNREERVIIVHLMSHRSDIYKMS